MAPLLALGIKAVPGIIGAITNIFSGKKDPPKHKIEILDDLRGAQDRVKDGFEVAKYQQRIDQILWDIADSKRAILAGERDPNTDGYSLIAYDQITAEYEAAKAKQAESQTITGQIQSIASPQNTGVLMIVIAVAAVLMIVYLLIKKK